ncbi:MFS transporter [Pediococcus argentinicus]|uniref:MFS transporter n=1 Tax=Pediococcus argentinicus TaxID=480391 RepID=UPI00338DBB8D
MKNYLSKNFIFILLSNALLFMVYNMQIPILPIYAQSIGMSASQIGTFVGILMFAALATRIFTANLAQQFTIKSLLIVGLALYFLATVGYTMFSVFGLLILLRIVNGIGHGLTTTFFATSAANELDTSEIGTGMGFFGIGTMVSASLAPLIAVEVTNHFGFDAFFVACVISLLLSLGFIAFTHSHEQVRTKKTKFELPKFDRNILPHCILVFILGVIMSGVMAFITIYAKQNHLTAVSWFFFTAAIAGVVIRPFVGTYFDQHGPRAVLIISTILLAVGIALLVVATSNWILILSGILYGAADVAIYPTLQAWLFKIVSSETRASATGTFLNSYNLGVGIGAVILGQLVALTSYHSMFISLTVISVLYIFLGILIVNRFNPNNN